MKAGVPIPQQQQNPPDLQERAARLNELVVSSAQQHQVMSRAIQQQHKQRQRDGSSSSLLGKGSWPAPFPSATSGGGGAPQATSSTLQPNPNLPTPFSHPNLPNPFTQPGTAHAPTYNVSQLPASSSELSTSNDSTTSNPAAKAPSVASSSGSSSKASSIYSAEQCEHRKQHGKPPDGTGEAIPYSRDAKALYQISGPHADGAYCITRTLVWLMVP